MAFQLTPDVKIKRDRDDIVRQLYHPQQAYRAEALTAAEVTPRALANQYVRDVLPIYHLETDMAADLSAAVSTAIVPEGPRLKFAEEKILRDQATVSYTQTHLGLPVWEAGLAVRMRGRPYGITSSQNSVHYSLDVQPPAADAPYLPERLDTERLRQLLGLGAAEAPPHINAKRLLIYQYDPNDRGNGGNPSEPNDETHMHVAAPTLPLPPVPESLQTRRHYVVSEVLFTLARPGWGALNWRTFIEPQTGAVLRLDAFVGCVDAFVFLDDPLIATGDTSLTPTSPTPDLDDARSRVPLQGLRPPTGSPTRQELQGNFVRLVDIEPPNVAPPSTLAPHDFLYSVPTDDFAAVNAYYHCDRLFRIVQDLGFDVASYFDGTTFPVRVDHRVSYDGNSNVVNASAPGTNTGQGSDGFRFALVQRNTQIGMAVEWPVVMHEFGHAILWDHLHSPNFRFAHSPGDSLAALLSAPGSRAPDRGRTFPWTPILRRHDRAVGAGWGWGGVHDDVWPVGHPFSGDRAGYKREQLLSSTLFHLYRAIGGDHQTLEGQHFAAEYTAYLILSAVGALSPTTPPQDAEDFADALMDADIGTLDFKGHPGGAVHKVIRWVFEQQGLYQPPGAPTPVTTPGAPPPVDVYIDDGRDGQYTPQSGFVAMHPDIWNRRQPDRTLLHEDPLTGERNSVYVRVKNRGTSPAANVVVQMFLCPGQGEPTWPTTWQPLTPAALAVAGTIPSGSEAIVGPFEWRPDTVGAYSLLASVSADGDPSNVDTVNGPLPAVRLAHWDNNIALRDVTAEPL